MPLFVNPFRKRDASTFPGVLIPLQRVRRSSTGNEAEGRLDGVAEDDTGGQTNADGVIAGSEDEALLPSDEGAVEDLRLDLEKEVCGCESSYDREYLPALWALMGFAKVLQASRGLLIRLFKILGWAGISGSYSFFVGWVGLRISGYSASLPRFSLANNVPVSGCRYLNILFRVHGIAAY